MDRNFLHAYAHCARQVRLLEPVVNAWETIDLGRIAYELERVWQAGLPGRMAGTLVGVKDVFDTADMPTRYGSPIFARHQPGQDAWVVRRMREAGLVIAGKTVTTEFAYLHPGKTANPADPTRSPGGSSSGSAAAVAADMVPLAIGTQTAGSTLRPAAYCGVYGYKPTYGIVPMDGCRPLAPSLDTVGLFARELDDLEALAQLLSQGSILTGVTKASPPRICVVPPEIGPSDAAVRAAFATLLSRLRSTGVPLELASGFPLQECVRLHRCIMAYEAAAGFRDLVEAHPTLISPEFQTLMHEGRACAHDDYAAARNRVDALRHWMDRAFDRFDLLLLPSAAEEAPLRTTGTGNPDWCRPASLLGLPAMNVPIGRSRAGLPLGVQIVARAHHDVQLLAAARWLVGI
ncbi:amidase [Pseudorhodoferax sp.]|uniref:amidase n=1 Tax=Pseudorhodoferax sp. TaxID=1993553 RepID=UPI002DD67E37|nr:amidase [Pseudorhodoferax sp.]